LGNGHYTRSTSERTRKIAVRKNIKREHRDQTRAFPAIRGKSIGNIASSPSEKEQSLAIAVNRAKREASEVGAGIPEGGRALGRQIKRCIKEKGRGLLLERVMDKIDHCTPG